MVELKNVYKSFNNEAVLENFSLSVKSGERICLMGRSGCGKSTVINLLLGILKPDRGTVIAPANAKAVFQENRLCEDFSALSNVRMVLSGDGTEKAKETLCALGLCEELSRPVRDFSGGMKRRVAIARALASDFDMLLLDEPFTGLDADSRKSAAEYILKQAEGKSILLVSHDPEDAELLDARIINL